MMHDRGRGIRGILLAAASGTIVFASAAHAQAASETPGAALRRQVAELAANPTSVVELVETGRAALAVGDGEGALGFFTRANELAPRDARVTAGLAAAHARTGRPDTALGLFSQAVALGAPEREIAADRGLAYDLLGQTARAQQDYVMSLRHREDAEVRQRLALSLAISGQREAALRLIEDQVRQGDRAASRTRVLVLALSGDVRGASDAARSSLPPQAVQAITPFLPRLASLSPAQMASAANLGRVPGAGGSQNAVARTGAAMADPGALAFAGGGSSALASRLPVAPAVTDAPRRRPGGVTEVAQITPRATTTTAQPTRNLASSTLRPATPTVSAPQPLLQPHPFEPLRLAAGASREARTEEVATAAAQPAAEPAATAQAPSESPPPVELASLQRERTEQPASADAPADGAAANLAVWSSGTAAAQPPAPANNTEAAPGFSDVVATVSSLNAGSAAATPARRTASEPASRSTARTQTARNNAPATTREQSPSRATRQNTAARTTAATTRATNPRQAHPSRVWVQLGVSSNRAAFAYDINRMRRAAPELRNQTPHTAPIGSSHRLVVGPFPNDAAARTFINGLREKNIPSIAWTSPAGTEVTRFTAR